MHAVEFVEGYFKAWNQSDANGVVSYLSENGVYCDVPYNLRQGRDDLLSNLKNFFVEERQNYQQIGDILFNEKSIAFQYKITPFDTDKPERFGSEFLTLDDNGVVSIIDYYELNEGHDFGHYLSEKMSTRKYAKSGLGSDQISIYACQLKRLLEVDRVYLDADLTLVKLAELMNCSVNHLSQVVNSGFEMSFLNLLHSYRVEDAKRMLADSSSKNNPILDISLAVGFNSSSAFYVAFKKMTGKTPAQYRRQNIELTILASPASKFA